MNNSEPITRSNYIQQLIAGLHAALLAPDIVNQMAHQLE